MGGVTEIAFDRGSALGQFVGATLRKSNTGNSWSDVFVLPTLASSKSIVSFKIPATSSRYIRIDEIVSSFGRPMLSGVRFFTDDMKSPRSCSNNDFETVYTQLHTSRRSGNREPSH